jgi:adenosylcobinamide kinase/adenosylcobinamide-phosphate guanylyltransferase
MPKMDPKTITLVLGGVRSGKSRYGQQLAERAGRVAYVATAKACDQEMRQKILRHQQDRPSHWTTFEEPLEIGRILTEEAAAFDLFLVDCLTIHVANLLEVADSEAGGMEQRVQGLLKALAESPKSVILVSNEVGSGVVPAYPAGRRFRDALGELNQRVAAIADHVVLLVAGLPLALKGTLGEKP